MSKMKRQYESKVFDTSTLAGLQSAERYQQRLYNLYDSVRVLTVGMNRVQIVGQVSNG